MKLAPSKWQGQARQLINDVLKEYFLPASRVESWHAFLERRLSEADATFMLMTTSPERKSRWGQEKSFQTRADRTVVFGDRAPATAIYTYLLEKDVSTSENAAALYLHLPHHSFDLDKFTKWAALTNNTASAGWLVAPLFGPSNDDAWETLSLDELRRRTIRHLHPLNHFLFPNLNKSGAVFADDPRMHALVAEAYSKHYGALWTRFLALTGDSAETLPVPTDFEVDFSSKVTTPSGAAIETKELISKIAPTDAIDLKLITVNESQGYHSRTLESQLVTRGFLDLKLDFKEKSGETRTVGYFRLNLKDLYDKKFLSRDKNGIRLLIHQTGENGAGFGVGPRKTGPLTPLP